MDGLVVQLSRNDEIFCVSHNECQMTVMFSSECRRDGFGVGVVYRHIQSHAHVTRMETVCPSTDLFGAKTLEAHRKAGIWHRAMEIQFSNQSSLCVDVSFQQNCRHKKNCRKMFFLQSNAFFAGKHIFLQVNAFFQATLFIKKIADGRIFQVTYLKEMAA
jgi:hypothetical protein